MIYLYLIVGLPILLGAIFGVVRGIVLFVALALLVIFQQRAATRANTPSLELGPCIIQLYILLLPIFISVQVVGPDVGMVFWSGLLVGFFALGYIKGPTEDS